MGIYEAAYGINAQNIINSIELINKSFSYSTKRRRRSMFDRFTNFLADNYGELTKDNIYLASSHFRGLVYSERGENTITTANSDYLAWANLTRKLISLGALPPGSIPPALRFNQELLKISNKNACLGSMNPKLWKNELRDEDLPALQSIDDHEYLDIFIESQLYHRNHLISLARNHISIAVENFLAGRKYIQNTDPSIFDTENLFHPTFTAHGSGQALSLFSTFLPNNDGLKNLVAFLHYKKEGLIRADFPGSNNHLYRFEGRTRLQEHLGLTSTLASACAIVIVAETGINVESLYRLELNPSEDIIEDQEGFNGYLLKYNKPRAGGKKHKLVKRETSKINAEYCFDIIKDLTENYRKQASPSVAKRLFIHDGVYSLGSIESISATAFKSGFKRIASQSQDIEFVASEPNLAKLRVSCGIIAWHQSGGDPRTAANFLGNSPRVALRNYIPKELQEFLYRKQIRQFQHLLIAIATDQRPYQQAVLGIKSIVDLDQYLEEHVTNSDLYKRAAKTETHHIDAINDNHSDKTTFVLSETNIAFLHSVNTKHKESSSYTTTPNPLLAKWATIATKIFGYIRSQGTRRQKHVMARGIELDLQNPAIYEL